MNDVLLISDCAKQVEVESHVLRYWEEELGLPIHRNELGHRIYTREDVEVFQRIKELKEKGLQLKAVKYLIQNDRLGSDDGLELLEDAPMGESDEMQIEILECHDVIDDRDGLKCDLGRQRANKVKKRAKDPVSLSEDQLDQVQRLERLIGNLIRESVRTAIYESRREICREILSDLEEDGWKSFREEASPASRKMVPEEETRPTRKMEPEEGEPEETETEWSGYRQEKSSRRGEEYYRRVDQMIRFGAGKSRTRGKHDSSK